MSAIVLSDVRRQFGDVQALAGLSLRVEPGEIYGLVGPDGAGKTTAIRAISGLIARDAGEVRVLGVDPEHDAQVREHLGVMPQRYSLYGDLSIAENLSFFADLFCLSPSTYAARAERLLGITRLRPFVDRRADSLSGGMYKKLALACALLHEPKVLLLDEPTNGVDPISRRELWALLHHFVSDGMAVLVSTPYMDEAARCHRVGLMREGRLLAEGTPRALIEAFDETVVDIGGLDAEAAEAALLGLPGVMTARPFGGRVRVLHRAAAGPSVAATLAGFRVTSIAVAPDFEDVFLAASAGAA